MMQDDNAKVKIWFKFYSTKLGLLHAANPVTEEEEVPVASDTVVAADMAVEAANGAAAADTAAAAAAGEEDAATIAGEEPPATAAVAMNMMVGEALIPIVDLKMENVAATEVPADESAEATTLEHTAEPQTTAPLEADPSGGAAVAAPGACAVEEKGAAMPGSELQASGSASRSLDVATVPQDQL